MSNPHDIGPRPNASTAKKRTSKATIRSRLIRRKDSSKVTVEGASLDQCDSNQENEKTGAIDQDEHCSICDEENQIAMAFLQYCATCDKQILTSTCSLYCSESCRRGDTSAPAATSNPALIFSKPLKPSPHLEVRPFGNAFIPRTTPNSHTSPELEILGETKVEFDQEGRITNMSAPRLAKSDPKREELTSRAHNEASTYLEKFYSGRELDSSAQFASPTQSSGRLTRTGSSVSEFSASSSSNRLLAYPTASPTTASTTPEAKDFQ